MSHVYDDGFYDYLSEGSRRSAEAVCAIVSPLLTDGATVLDLGCGQGVWTRQFQSLPGVAQAIGVDGAYVDRARLAIPADQFVPHDLATPLALGRSFTLALSLEVGEHLPPAATEVLVDSLAAHSDLVLFSAATPGQGGEHHVNERPLEDWRRAFAARGYAAFDAIRPRIAGNGDVEPWYRYNVLLYARGAAEARVREVLRASPLPPEAPIPDLSPWTWRLRCALLGTLPPATIDWLAHGKHLWVRRTRQWRLPS